jgi:hypothetical protein
MAAGAAAACQLSSLTEAKSSSRCRKLQSEDVEHRRVPHLFEFGNLGIDAKHWGTGSRCNRDILLAVDLEGHRTAWFDRWISNAYDGCFQPLQCASSCRAMPGSSMRMMRHRSATRWAQPRITPRVGDLLPIARQRRSTSRTSGNTFSHRSDHRTNCCGGSKFFSCAKRLRPVETRKSGTGTGGHGGGDIVAIVVLATF